MDTIVTGRLSGSVHIVPLGHEIDRAVAPFRGIRTDGVHLLTIVSRGRHDREMFERQEYFTQQVEKELGKERIPVDVWDVDIFDMHDVLRYVSGLIALERRRGRKISVNASASGRFTSIGAAMAGMAHDVEVYYVEADAYSANEDDVMEHGQSICWGSAPPPVLDPLKFELPKEPALRLLADIAIADPKEMRTQQLTKFMREHRVGVFTDNPTREDCSNQQIVTSLNKILLDQLENKYKYVIREKIGRQRRVLLTKAGMNIAYLSGHMPITGPVRSSGSRSSPSPGSP